MNKEYFFLFICLLILIFIYYKNKDKKYVYNKLDLDLLKKIIKKKQSIEEQCRFIIESIFNKPFPKTRPSFLINPLTNKRLELDCFNPLVTNSKYIGGLAFEIDGEQHNTFIRKWHKTREGFFKQIQRDKIKDHLCEQYNILLIRIPTHIENKRKYIIDKLIFYNMLK